MVGGNCDTEDFWNVGLHVIATARRPEVLAGLAEMGMSALQLDVTDQDSIEACEKEVATITGGKLDILINNAQVFLFYPMQPLETGKLRKHEHANTTAWRYKTI